MVRTGGTVRALAFVLFAAACGSPGESGDGEAVDDGTDSAEVPADEDGAVDADGVTGADDAETPAVEGVGDDAPADADAWATSAWGRIYRWSGTSWSDVPSGTTNRLWSVWGTRADDVWAVGDEGTILHWTGAEWTPLPTGTRQPLYSAWGASTDDVWMAGDDGVLLHFRE
jgi:hypothetical protein